MNPLIKWPGGKSGEIGLIQGDIPEYERYVEPFLGGGAMYFHLCPEKAAVNDSSKGLMDFYALVKNRDERLRAYLLMFDDEICAMLAGCREGYQRIYQAYKEQNDARVRAFARELISDFTEELVLDRARLLGSITEMACDKMRRTRKLESVKPFSEEDMRDNLTTGFISGYYMYFRGVYNDIALGRAQPPNAAYETAVFYFIREYCYGSMFRYNKKGEFNIPYGGRTYNNKNLRAKIDGMFGREVSKLLSGASLYCEDFERFLDDIALTQNDFVFLDPPYDTDFSEYEGCDFTRDDHKRLADYIRRSPAKMLLIIKNTDFIRGLYGEGFNVRSFDNRYSYNMRSRNERVAEHLIVTNF